MEYAKLLTIVKHGEKGTASLDKDAEDAEYQYAEVNVANPWKAGTLLHRYILIPKGEEGMRRLPDSPCNALRAWDALPIP